jgi:hypothetical protein
MNPRNPITADDLDAAVTAVVTTLQAGVDRDWSVPAGSLEWSCRETVDHMCHCLINYSAQVAVQASTHYVRTFSRARLETSTPDLIEVVEACSRILAQVVRGAAPSIRAWHPFGASDPEGFAGSGCIEVLLHGYDIANGLDLTLDPPRDVCDRVLTRMFPEQASKLVDIDPWTALRWVTGRADLPGIRHVQDWSWRTSPLTEEPTPG